MLFASVTVFQEGICWRFRGGLLGSVQCGRLRAETEVFGASIERIEEGIEIQGHERRLENVFEAVEASVVPPFTSPSTSSEFA